MVYDLAGQDLATVNALGQFSTNVYDGAGRNIAQVNPLGTRWTSVYDELGQMVASVNPQGYRSTTVYDGALKTVASVNPLGEVITIAYDESGTTGVTDASCCGSQTTPSVPGVGIYFDAGRPITSIDGSGNRNTTVYDAAGQAIARVNPLGFRSTSVHSETGQVIGSVDANGNITRFTYDVIGRRVERLMLWVGSRRQFMTLQTGTSPMWMRTAIERLCLMMMPADNNRPETHWVI